MLVQVSRFTTLGKYGVVLSLGEGSERSFEPPVVDFGNVATVSTTAGGTRRETPAGFVRDEQAVEGRVSGEELDAEKEGRQQEGEWEYMPHG